MVAFLLASSLALSGLQSDVKAFQNAFALRQSEMATAKLDPGVAKAMDILIEKLRRDTDGNTSAEEVTKMLNPYSRAVSTEEVFPTTYASLGASISRGMGKIAIGVRMGAVSRLRVFNAATGKPVAVPKAFDWQYQYHANPIILSGGKVLVDSPAIQDAGVRYTYRVSFLNPGPNGYTLARQLTGIWTLGDEGDGHLSIGGDTMTLSTIDAPKSFITTSPERLFTRVTTYDLGGTAPRSTKTEVKEPTFRALDDWMAAAMKAPKTELEKRFVKAYGKEPRILETWSIKRQDKAIYIELIAEDKFVFLIERKADGYEVMDFTCTKG